jgi:hypothetical protein
MNDSTKILYRGAISFSHSLIWIGVMCVTFGAFYFALPPLIELFGGDFVFPFIAEVSAITFAIGIILPVLLLAMKLKIQIRQDGIYLKIFPFHLSYRRISWDDLANYGSYEHQEKKTNKLGIRYTITGKSYGLGGRRGIMLELVNGGKVYIESRRPEKIIEVIKTVNNKEG